MKNTANLKKGISALIAISILLIVLLTVSVFAVSDSTVAYAAEKQYIFIPYDGALKDLQTAKQSSYIFYSNSESDGFYLPQTYYVELISGVDNGQNYYECKYRGISGKINKHEVLTNNIVSASELSNYTSFVEYPQLSLTPINDTVNTGFSDTFSKAEYSFYYLGEATTSQPDNNNRQIAVLLISSKNSNVPTVKTITANQFESFTVPLHPITEQEKNAAIGSGGADGTLDPEGTVSNPALRALLIAGIVVPALILVIMIFIPRKKKDNYDRFVQRRGGSPYDEPKQPYMSSDRNYGRRANDRDYYPNDRDYYRDDRAYQGRDNLQRDRYDGDYRDNYDTPRSNDYYPDDYDRRDRRYR